MEWVGDFSTFALYYIRQLPGYIVFDSRRAWAQVRTANIIATKLRGRASVSLNGNSET
jgi:hypothetical protein